MTTTTRKPDSDFRYRIVSGYDGHRLTWHSLECNTGRKAKYAKRTPFTPEERRARMEERRGYRVYYSDHMARCCLAKPTTSSPTFTPTQARALLREARTAGLAAGDAATPTPMVVGTPTTPLGDDIDPDKQTYYVPDGVCGFAWVVIRPGNSSIARAAKKLGIGDSAYGGGMAVWIHDHGQSMERKQRHAAAYADVLRAKGINATSQSRMD